MVYPHADRTLPHNYNDAADAPRASENAAHASPVTSIAILLGIVVVVLVGGWLFGG